MLKRKSRLREDRAEVSTMNNDEGSPGETNQVCDYEGTEIWTLIPEERIEIGDRNKRRMDSGTIERSSSSFLN